jgi:hypothetical protein
MTGDASGKSLSNAAFFWDVGTDGLMKIVRALGMRSMRATSVNTSSQAS